MVETLLYIGEDLVDLGGAIIAVSVKRIEVSELNARYVTYADAVEIPINENNSTLFGFANDETSGSTKPYRFLDCKLIQGGVETIPNARLYVSRANKKFRINIFENFIDFFQGIKGKTLAEIMPFANSAWTAAGIDAARTNTSGIVSAVMNWGKSTSMFELNYFLPCFYYHSAITAILQHTGLTLSGDILTDARFTDLVIPYPGGKFEYDERLNILNTLAYTQADQSFGVTASGSANVQFDVFQYGASNWSGADKYIVGSNGQGVTLGIDVSFRVTIDTWGDGANLTVSIAVNGVNTGTDYTLTSPATDSGVQTLNLPDGFSSGDEITLLVEGDAPTSDIGVVVKTGTSLTVTYDTTVNRDSINWNVLLPEIKCEDLLEDFFTRFGIIAKQVDNTMVLKTLESICADRAGAVDWSGKLVKSAPEIDFGLGYAQNNYFNYQDSEDVNNAELGRGNMAISNEIVDVSRDIYTSLFGNTKILLIADFRVAHIPVYDSTSTGIDTFANEPGLRLLTLKARTIETAITFDATPRTDYKLAYFVDPVQTKDTGFEYFLAQFYPSLSISLQLNKNVNKYFRLNQLDIANYDPHKMIYDGVGYYIAKIDRFIPDQITKCPLFKVS